MKKFFLSFLMLLLVPCIAMGAELAELNKGSLDSMLENNRGKVIMLNFFATWCPPCRVEIPELAKLRASYPESEFLLIGLSVDEDKSQVIPFATENKVNYPIYAAARDITDAYNVTSVPHNTFIARDGRVIISEPGMADMKLLKQVVDDLLSRKP